MSTSNSREHALLTLLTALVICVAGGLICCATSMAQEDMPVDAAKRAEIIDSVTSTLNRAYVFPDVAKEMEQHVRELLKKHEYDTISSTNQFTQ